MPDDDGAVAAVDDVCKIAAVASTELPTRPSNEVVTPVTVVQGIKSGPNEEDNGGGGPEVQSGTPGTDVLASTGGGLPVPGTLFLSGLLLLGGIALVRVGRPVHRRTTG